MGLAIAWLLPNHSRPWTSFHSDACAAFVLLCVALAVIWHSRPGAKLGLLTGIGLLLAGVPMVQWLAGLMPSFGAAVLCSAYVLGFALAAQVGQTWARTDPNALFRFLAVALAIASVVSTLMAIFQWSGASTQQDGFAIWVVGSRAYRPGANLGQPNQLATLLLWGMIGCFMLMHMRIIGVGLGWFLLLLMAVGLGLTESRGGFIGAAIVMGITWAMRRRLNGSASGWMWVPMALTFVTVFFGNRSIASQWAHDAGPTVFGRSGNEARIDQWRMVWDAVLERPWLGYGWNSMVSAHMAVAERHSRVDVLLAQAHNQFLDLMVWMGIPLGALVSLLLLAWLLFVCTRRLEPLFRLLLLMLVVIALHAMVEYPLHYGYFLWPTGLAVGAISAHMPMFLAGWNLPHVRTGALAACLAGFATLGLVTLDYLRAEESLSELTFRYHGFVNAKPVAPKLMVLDQLSEFYFVFDYEVQPEPTSAQVERLARATRITHSVLFLSKYILTLELLGRCEEAQLWQRKLAHSTTIDWRDILSRQRRDLKRRHPQWLGGQGLTTNDSYCKPR